MSRSYSNGFRGCRDLIKIIVLVTILLPNLVGAIVLPISSLFSAIGSNATAHHRLAVSNTRPVCTAQTTWMLDGKGPGQAACSDFLNRYKTEIETFRLRAYEFTEPSAPPTFGLPTILTPKKWTLGK